jgi:S1-C subfamily serine protease
VTETKNGLRVERIRPGSPIDRLGVERGDLVLGLAGSPTKTLAEFRRRIIDVRLSQGLFLSIGRGRQRYHVTVPLDQG